MSDRTGQHIESLRLWQTLEEHDGGGAWGFVTDYSDIAKVIKEYEKFTVSQYVIDYNTIMYKAQKDMDVFHKKIRFEDFGDNKIPKDGSPFIIGGSIRYSCQRGMDRHTFSKNKYKSSREELAKENPDGVRMYKKRKEGSKVGCTSRIYVKKVILFPQYKMQKITSYQRMKVTREIKKLVNDGKENGTVRYYIKLPISATHTNHQVAQDSSIKRLDKRLMDEIRRLVKRDVHSADRIRTHLECFVRDNIRPLPSHNDAAYYPSLNILRGHMNRAQRTMKMQMYNEEKVGALVENWHTSHPEDKLYFRSTRRDDCSDENDTFLLLCQTKYQRHLLQRYGETVIMDPVYRFIKYGLPLFFLEVKTNSGFAVVGVFVCQSDSVDVISEAMKCFKQWNPSWTPQYFMTDVCDGDVQALQNVFQGCTLLYSDFHRQSNWENWLKNKANNVADKFDQIWEHLQRIAGSSSENQFHCAVTNFNETQIWQDSQKLRKWFTSQWLALHRKWVWYFRKHCGLLINSTDADCLGKIFKAKYLKRRWSMGVSSMMKLVLQTFIPKQIRKYVTENRVTLCKQSQPSIPDFLQNRPNGYVIACLHNITLAERMPYTDVFAMDFTTNTYKVQCTSNPFTTYTVTIDPFECECYEWQKTCIPCRHLFAVLLYTPFSWQHISQKYKQSCYTTIDYEMLNHADHDSTLHQTQDDIEDDAILDEEPAGGDDRNDDLGRDEDDSDDDSEDVDETASPGSECEGSGTETAVPDENNEDTVKNQAAGILGEVREVLKKCDDLMVTFDAGRGQECQHVYKMAQDMLALGNRLHGALARSRKAEEQSLSKKNNKNLQLKSKNRGKRRKLTKERTSLSESQNIITSNAQGPAIKDYIPQSHPLPFTTSIPEAHIQPESNPHPTHLRPPLYDATPVTRIFTGPIPMNEPLISPQTSHLTLDDHKHLPHHHHHLVQEEHLTNNGSAKQLLMLGVDGKPSYIQGDPLTSSMPKQQGVVLSERTKTVDGGDAVRPPAYQQPHHEQQPQQPHTNQQEYPWEQQWESLMH